MNFVFKCCLLYFITLIFYCPTAALSATQRPEYFSNLNL